MSFSKGESLPAQRKHASAQTLVVLFLRLLEHACLDKELLSATHILDIIGFTIEVKCQSCLNWGSQAPLEPGSHMGNSVNGSGTSTGNV